MVTIENFIKEELNEYSRKVILDCIRNGENSLKEKEEIEFNRYSLEILFSEKKVIIYDDVFSENEPLEIELNNFTISIKQ
ncbi:MAG: hypothetical protein PHH37_11435 [Paludibacter sp.]|nr:hypothetical protein [Paludibacter sp.]